MVPTVSYQEFKNLWFGAVWCCKFKVTFQFLMLLNLLKETSVPKAFGNVLRKAFLKKNKILLREIFFKINK
jgi:hypothetical protein